MVSPLVLKEHGLRRQRYGVIPIWCVKKSVKTRQTIITIKKKCKAYKKVDTQSKGSQRRLRYKMNMRRYEKKELSVTPKMWMKRWE